MNYLNLKSNYIMLSLVACFSISWGNLQLNKRNKKQNNDQAASLSAKSGSIMTSQNHSSNSSKILPPGRGASETGDLRANNKSMDSRPLTVRAARLIPSLVNPEFGVLSVRFSHNVNTDFFRDTRQPEVYGIERNSEERIQISSGMRFQRNGNTLQIDLFSRMSNFSELTITIRDDLFQGRLHKVNDRNAYLDGDQDGQPGGMFQATIVVDSADFPTTSPVVPPDTPDQPQIPVNPGEPVNPIDRIVSDKPRNIIDRNPPNVKTPPVAYEVLRVVSARLFPHPLNPDLGRLEIQFSHNVYTDFFINTRQHLVFGIDSSSGERVELGRSLAYPNNGNRLTIDILTRLNRFTEILVEIRDDLYEGALHKHNDRSAILDGDGDGQPGGIYEERIPAN